MELEEQGLNPRDIVKHVVRTAIAATRERNISIQAIVADDVPTLVIGDPLRIKQVITNLVKP
jgi:two-component system sensor histidine kinase BarA